MTQCRAKDTQLPLRYLIFMLINYSLFFRISDMIYVRTPHFHSLFATDSNSHMFWMQRTVPKHENCKKAFHTWSCMVCSIWVRLLGNIDFKALSFFTVHNVFCWITTIPLFILLAIQSAECTTVARSYYAQITFPSLYNPNWHKGKLFMICNYVFTIR